MRSINTPNIKFKAAEYLFFLKVCGPVILKEILHDNVHDHFLLLHSAFRLLCRKNAIDYVEEAREYIKKFVHDAPGIYGDSFMSINIHNTLHSCDDVEYLKCNLMQLSAFRFESFLYRVKIYARVATHLAVQLRDRFDEEFTFIGYKQNIPSTDVTILQKNTENKILKIKYKNYVLGIKEPNNLFILQNGRIVEINKIFFNLNKYTLHIRKEYKIKKPCYKFPKYSGFFLEYELYPIEKEKDYLISIDDIKFKMIKLIVNFSVIESNEFLLYLLSTKNLSKRIKNFSTFYDFYFQYHNCTLC